MIRASIVQEILNKLMRLSRNGAMHGDGTAMPR